MSIRPVLLLDVDGVLADFVGAYLELLYRYTGREFSADYVREWDIARALGVDAVTNARIKSEIDCETFRPYSPTLADELAPIAEAARVYFVTAPLGSCPTWTAKRESWLRQHVGTWTKGRVLHVPRGAKRMVRGDVLVEDNAETAAEWSEANPDGAALVWRRPWNSGRPCQPGPYAYISSWRDVAEQIRALTET